MFHLRRLHATFDQFVDVSYCFCVDLIISSNEKECHTITERTEEVYFTDFYSHQSEMSLTILSTIETQFAHGNFRYCCVKIDTGFSAIS